MNLLLWGLNFTQVQPAFVVNDKQPVIHKADLSLGRFDVTETLNLG